MESSSKVHMGRENSNLMHFAADLYLQVTILVTCCTDCKASILVILSKKTHNIKITKNNSGFTSEASFCKEQD